MSKVSITMDELNKLAHIIGTLQVQVVLLEGELTRLLADLSAQAGKEQPDVSPSA